MATATTFAAPYSIHAGAKLRSVLKSIGTFLIAYGELRAARAMQNEGIRF
ncbi:hypothetical protein [Donghicola tyrosinivorans]|jgi:hypothetical protein|uniref:Uncharacterized protein n=1 Tax=Donghicola tyrosinivorans TaxID=1652492 RepID=A0A2T0WRY8_9RHOB|nr:hypothetical protein [Donghicola tyrosinivorans]MEC9196249.1 hypothetical protein [Pseudomonadota bacterium]PRY89473.1 hypothetical protein CLV74_106175 [Donghicola tyrosinivorans]